LEDWAQLLSMTQKDRFGKGSKYAGQALWKVDPEGAVQTLEVQVPSSACQVVLGRAASKHDDVEKENWVFQDPLPQEVPGQGRGGGRLSIGNTHEDLPLAAEGQENHRWGVYVRGQGGEREGPALALIAKVVFHLHEDFSPASVEVAEAPFEVHRLGWGVFDVLCEIHLRRGGVMRCQHSLCFEGDGSSSTSVVPLGLDWSRQQKLALVGRGKLDQEH
jgi:hypothetical protein